MPGGATLSSLPLGLCPALAEAGAAEPAAKAPVVVELRVQPAALVLENARDARRVLVFLRLTQRGGP